MATRMLGGRATLVGMVVVATGIFCLALGSVGVAAPRAHAARHTLRLTETVNLHLVKKKGPILRESGTGTGTLPGTVSARFDTSNALRVTGTVTFHPYSGGGITATVVGYPQSLATVAKFSGGMSVKSGTGRFAHVAGGGPFNGTVNRKSWRVTVHTTNIKLTY